MSDAAISRTPDFFSFFPEHTVVGKYVFEREKCFEICKYLQSVIGFNLRYSQINH